MTENSWKTSISSPWTTCTHQGVCQRAGSVYLAKYGNNETREMEFGSFDSADDAKHNGVNLVEMSEIFANTGWFFIWPHHLIDKMVLEDYPCWVTTSWNHLSYLLAMLLDGLNSWFANSTCMAWKKYGWVGNLLQRNYGHSMCLLISASWMNSSRNMLFVRYWHCYQWFILNCVLAKLIS